jgi:hypothetical protein
MLKPAFVFQVNRYTGRTPGMAPDRRRNGQLVDLAFAGEPDLLESSVLSEYSRAARAADVFCDRAKHARSSPQEVIHVFDLNLVLTMCSHEHINVKDQPSSGEVGRQQGTNPR